MLKALFKQYLFDIFVGKLWINIIINFKDLNT